MEEHSVAYIALDTSKLSNAVALAEGGRDGEIRYLGEIENTAPATAKLVAQPVEEVRQADVLFMKPGRRDMGCIVS